jgi:hypothetical protein
VAVISYHSGDAYNNASATQRFSYYGIGGTPYVQLDGNFQVVGGIHTGTMYPVYRDYFDTRKSVASPLTMDMSTTYDSTSRQGHLTVIMRNPGSSPVSGQLQVALTENHHYFVWQGMDSLHHVERAMLPDANGEAVSIPAGDSLVKTRDFTLDPGWVARNCNLIAFVQNNSTKEIYQGARTAVQARPDMKYLGYQVAFPRPGQTENLVIGLANRGMAGASGVSATLSSTDSFVTVNTANASFPDVARGGSGFSLAPYQIQVGSSCPDPHLATLNLAISDNSGQLSNTSFPVNITATPGFSDEMETGINGWTHSGIGDQWHQTTHRSQSSSHSWYCGTEGGWQYTNENDASLITPYFTLGSITQVGFYHYDTTELGFDYGMAEINNGSEFWSQLASFTGSSHGWQQALYDVPDYGGQTVRVRFRFMSDYNVTAEGWYIDDFYGGPMMAVAEKPANPTEVLKLDVRTPVSSAAQIRYEIPLGVTGSVTVYDASGRLVKTLANDFRGTGTATWNLKDAQGGAAKNGCYFVHLNAGNNQAMSKLVVTR